MRPPRTVRSALALTVVTLALGACMSTTQGVISDAPASDTLLRYEILEPYDAEATSDSGIQVVTIDPLTDRPVGTLDGDIRFDYGPVPVELTHLGDRVRWATGETSTLWIGETAYTLRWIDIHRDGSDLREDESSGLALTFVHQDAASRTLHLRARVEPTGRGSVFEPLALHVPSAASEHTAPVNLGIDLAQGMPTSTHCTAGEEPGTLRLAQPVRLTAAQVAALEAVL